MRWVRIVIPVLLLAVVLAAGFLLGWGIYPKLWHAATGPSVRRLRIGSFPTDPATVERGRYLAESVLACSRCHSDRDWQQEGAPPVRPYAGHRWATDGSPWLVAPNLTSDRETGAAAWTDDMIARAIREGVAHNGRALMPQAWYPAFSALSDEDVDAVVAYLRTLPPQRNLLPQTQATWRRRLVANATANPKDGPIPLPGESAAAKRGQYLEWIADCAGCHTDWYHPGSAVNEQLFGGGNALHTPLGTVYSPNITFDPSGISYYDEALFIKVMRTGMVGARKLNPVMPWYWYRNLSDDDLRALYAWLRFQKPVKHIVDNTEPPTWCPRCRQYHGGGSENVAPVPSTAK